MTLTKETEKQLSSLAEQTQEGFLDNQLGAFFRRIDWAAFWVAFIVALGVYVYTLAPTVTLEDGGELAVASDYLGVPHPPGYPIWTLITWFFQWVFHWVTYHGHPNPSWSVGLASAVAGALGCGFLALLVSRSGADLLRSAVSLNRKLDFRAESLICLAGGISGGLLLAFSPVLWSQSVIVEVYSLNALFQIVILLLIYMWMCRPKNDRLLLWVAFLFGLGLTNHQTLLFLGVALALAVMFKDLNLFRDFVVAAILMGVVFALAAKGRGLFGYPPGVEQFSGFSEGRYWKWTNGPDSPFFWVWNYLFLAIPVSLAVGAHTQKQKIGVRLAISTAAALGIYLVCVWGYKYFGSPVLTGHEEFSPWFFNTMKPPLDALTRLQEFDRWLWSVAGRGNEYVLLLQALMLLPILLGLTKLPRAKIVAGAILLAELGVAFYMYLPLASEQNPGMNWGYARTWEGFIHAVSRGQYEKVIPTDIFSEKFIKQVGAYLYDLRSQFTLGVVILGFLPFCTWSIQLNRKRYSAFTMALCFALPAMLLIILETLFKTSAFEPFYRLAIVPVLAIAGWGLVTLAMSYVRDICKKFNTYTIGVQIVLVLCALGVVGTLLLIDTMSLKAVFGTPQPEVPGGPVPEALSRFGKSIFLLVVFAPPLSFILAWILSDKRISPLELDFDMGHSQQRWLLVSFIGFIFVSIVFLIFQNPSLDLQQLFIGRVQFIQSHAIYAIWLGYGAILTFVCVDQWLKGAVRPILLVLTLLLPGILLYQNAFDENQIRTIGGAEQNGHDFGWQFGNWQLQGIDGIEEDLRYDLSPEKFEEEWANYPTPGYPPPMTENAIFYGGTDPGRFVPTYMIYSARVRPDVYLITQNALADHTFMNITRDLYGDTIFIPTQEESNLAFQEYIDDVQSGRLPADADLKIRDGRVSVEGVGGVMAINGILAKLIFEKNKFRHDFYVEESYAIQWMYPYLTPHGLIMKINKEPLARLPADIVENDHKFWDWYTQRLLGTTKFTRDICARKSFSKLRTAIGGLYEWRGMFDEAEYAYQQAIDLYPLSPEVNFRMAQLYMRTGRHEEAERLIAKLAQEDPLSEGVAGFLKNIVTMRESEARRIELEALLNEGKLDLNSAFELINLYRNMRLNHQAVQLAVNILQHPQLPPNVLMALAQVFGTENQVAYFAEALTRYLQFDPNNLSVLLDLGAANAMMNRPAEAVAHARKAIEIGGLNARQNIQSDPRYQSLHDNPEFLALFQRQTIQGITIPSQPAVQPGARPPMIPGLAQ